MSEDGNTTKPENASGAPVGVDALVRDLEWARQCDPIVASTLRRGGTYEQCIVRLVEQKAELMQRLMVLERIAPRRVHVGGGEMKLWRCPEQMIP